MDWNATTADAAAQVLLEHREAARTLPVPPAAARPAGTARGYAIQDALVGLIAARGGRAIGYKIAATNVAARAALGAEAPFHGRLFDATSAPSPAAFPAIPGFFRVFEAEIALLVGRDLPPGEAPFDADRLAAATEALLPAIEIIGTRIEPWMEAGAPLLVADNAAHGVWIHGAPVRDWSAFDPLESPITLAIDGGEPLRGAGRNVEGGPFGAAAWLANELAARGRFLRAGDYVTTGTVTAPLPVEQGQVARADFGPLGIVEVSIGP